MDEEYQPQVLLMQNVHDLRRRLQETERNLHKLKKIERKETDD